LEIYQKEYIIMTIIFHIYITRINANNNTIRRKKALSNTLNEIIYRAD